MIVIEGDCECIHMYCSVDAARYNRCSHQTHNTGIKTTDKQTKKNGRPGRTQSLTMCVSLLCCVYSSFVCFVALHVLYLKCALACDAYSVQRKFHSHKLYDLLTTCAGARAHALALYSCTCSFWVLIGADGRIMCTPSE